MTDFLQEWYPWIKAFHVISVIAWISGLLYLPRLFVYHAAAPIGSDSAETFKVMELRLLRGIMLPAIGLTYLFGASLAAAGGADWDEWWIWLKLSLVVLLTVFHMLLAGWRRAFAEDRYPHPPGFFRAVNEIPAVIMVGIVILVVVKPF